MAEHEDQPQEGESPPVDDLENVDTQPRHTRLWGPKVGDLPVAKLPPVENIQALIPLCDQADIEAEAKG